MSRPWRRPLITHHSSLTTVAAVVVWGLALALSSLGYVAGQRVYERGVAYGDPGPALPDLDGSQRAINVQLELEPDEAAQRRSLRLIREAGFGWIRQQFKWEDVERGGKGQFVDTARGQSTWAGYDQIVRLAHEEGLRVIARVDRTPAWARPSGTSSTHPPVDTRDFADFVGAFVTRYRGQIGHVQLWNEPNLNNEWGDRPVDPVAYVELLRAGYQAAKRADPSVRILSGELAQTLEPDAPGSRGLNDLVYLDRMYDHGAQPFFDILAANAYGLWTGPADRQLGAEYTNFARVLLVHDVMQRHGDGGKAVWITEFGWNALPPDWQGDPSPWGQVSPAKQASYLLGAYTRARREWPWLGPMAIWLFRQAAADPRDPTPYFALVDANWRPRPAYTQFAQTTVAVLGPGIHQETSEAIHYDREWQWTTDPQASLGGIRESPVPSASAAVRFDGTRIDLLAGVGPDKGIAYASVNDSYTLANRLPLNQFGQATIDLYAPEARSQQRFAVADGLPGGVHEMKITVTGEHSARSTGVGVGIDAIVVSRTRPATPLALLAGGWLSGGAMLLWWLRPRVINAAWPVWTSLPKGLTSFGTLPWRRVGVLAVAAALPLAPIAVRTPAGRYSPVELLVLGTVAVGALTLYLRGELPRWRGAFTWPLLVMVLAGVVSLFVASYPRLALRELRTLVLEPAAFYVIARSALRGPRDGLRLAGVFTAGATVASALAIGQTLTGRGLVAAEGVTRAGALYPSPNNLALLLDRAVPLAASLGLAGHGSFAVAAVVCGMALFFTFSKGAWLGTGVGMAMLAITVGSQLPSRQRRRALAIAIAAVVPVLIVAAAMAARFERLRSGVTGVFRIYLWRSSLDMIKDHPLWGVGLDQFLYHYPRYILPEAWREPNLSHPHNLLLDFWLSLGILGLLALLWSAWRFVRLVRLAPVLTGDSPVRRAIARGAAASGVALLAHGFVDNSYFVLDLAYATLIVLLLAELAGDPIGQNDHALG